jgi:hypothetical protein
MKQIALIFCILFLVTSCEIQYDGETKMVVTGKIIDQNGNSLSEKEIEVTIDGGTAFLSPSSDLISYGKSDQNGNFTLIFPAPKGDNSIYISINNIINQPSEFQAKEISANQNNFENYKLNLDKITLYKNESITTLKVILNKTSTNKQLTDIKIEGKLPNSYINLNPIQNNSYYYLETYYQVIKNQTIALKYTIIDHSNSATPTVQSISIPIVNDAVTYTITY